MQVIATAGSGIGLRSMTSLCDMFLRSDLPADFFEGTFHYLWPWGFCVCVFLLASEESFPTDEGTEIRSAYAWARYLC